MIDRKLAREIVACKPHDEVRMSCQRKKNVSANLRRMATGQENVPIQLLMMDCARSATKRRERQKQILWAARQLLRVATP
jgi:hypothetical protein